MSEPTFWGVVNAQLSELRAAQTADDVIRILSKERDPYRLTDPTHDVGDCDGFFAGSGGDGTVRESLRLAGWHVVWSEASYYYVMQAPGGDRITYVEGDVYRGDRRA